MGAGRARAARLVAATVNACARVTRVGSAVSGLLEWLRGRARVGRERARLGCSSRAVRRRRFLAAVARRFSRVAHLDSMNTLAISVRSASRFFAWRVGTARGDWSASVVVALARVVGARVAAARRSRARPTRRLQAEAPSCRSSRAGRSGSAPSWTGSCSWPWPPPSSRRACPSDHSPRGTPRRRARGRRRSRSSSAAAAGGLDSQRLRRRFWPARCAPTGEAEPRNDRRLGRFFPRIFPEHT